MTGPTRAAGAPARPRTRFRRAAGRLRRSPPGQEAALLALVALSVLLLLGTVRIGVPVLPPSAQVVPLLFGGLLLGRRAMGRLLVLVAVVLACAYAVTSSSRAAPGAVVPVAVAALFAWESARSRDQTGLGGGTGGAVLVELRRRLEQQGRTPSLPEGWHAEAVVRPAGGGPFSGDFVVSSVADDRLEVVLVDVSGKGVDAGTRALLLSGALGGLLGRGPGDVLAAASEYLVRQDWEEGFATAVHLVVDLPSGEFAVRSAGHPPVAQFDAGSGRWRLVEAAGVALGLLPGTSYEPERGRLDPGDALVLYTDGLVEIPGRDLSVGIDKLLGEAERLVPRGFDGGADRLVALVAGGSPDDRGLVLLWRTG